MAKGSQLAPFDRWSLRPFILGALSSEGDEADTGDQPREPDPEHDECGLHAHRERFENQQSQNDEASTEDEAEAHGDDWNRFVRVREVAFHHHLDEDRQALQQYIGAVRSNQHLGFILMPKKSCPEYEDDDDDHGQSMMLFTRSDTTRALVKRVVQPGEYVLVIDNTPLEKPRGPTSASSTGSSSTSTSGTVTADAELFALSRTDRKRYE